MTIDTVFNIKNKTYLITGGSGYLGKVIIENLLKCGSQVINISSKPVDVLSLNLKDCDVSNYKEHIGDINDEKFMSGVSIELKSSKRKLDGLLHLASRGTRGIDLNIDSVTFGNQLSEGVECLWSTLKISLEHLKNNSSVIVFGSMWGKQVPNSSVYLDLKNEPGYSIPPSKAALEQITKYLAAEFISKGIRFNILTPGWFPKPGNKIREDYIFQITSRVPAKRIGIPNDLVGPVIFLLSDCSNYVVGHDLIVDGGFSLW